LAKLTSPVETSGVFAAVEGGLLTEKNDLELDESSKVAAAEILDALADKSAADTHNRER
jgi:hypothetical protein